MTIVREFDGSDDQIVVALGDLAAVNAGAVTLAAIAKRDTDTGSWRTYLSAETSGGAARRLWMATTNSGGLMTLITGTSEPSAGVTHSASDDWVLVAVTKPSGTATVRGHKYVYSTGTWTHAEGSSSDDDGVSLAGGHIRLGSVQNSDYWDGRIAVIGGWTRALSDSELEALTGTLQAWLDAEPAALWPLNQAAVTTAVEDVTGGGADQLSRVGTTVVDDQDLVFSFDLGEDVTSDGVSHGHTAGQPVLSQVHSLIPDGAGHGHAAGQPALSQAHTLAPDDAGHAHAAGQPALSQAHQLTAGDTTHGHAAGQPDLTQVHALAADASSHSHSAESPQLGGTGTIATAAASHPHTAGQPQLVQAHLLAAGGAAHGHTSAQPPVMQAHHLVPAGAGHAHMAGVGQVTVAGVTLTPADTIHGHAAARPTLTQLHLLAAADATHGHTAGSPAAAPPGPPTPAVTAAATTRSTSVRADVYRATPAPAVGSTTGLLSTRSTSEVVTVR